VNIWITESSHTQGEDDMAASKKSYEH
jgi:hypothetical protein